MPLVCMDRYISIRKVLDDLLDHPLLKDLTLERVVKHTIDFIRKVGMPSIFEEKVTILEVKDYMAKIPCDYYQVLQVREHKSGEVFRNSSDNFHMGNHKSSTDYTYKIQGMVIHTSIREVELEFAYQAILVDEEGYPLLPDNSSFTEALELYIKKKHFTVQFDMGKISAQVLQQTLQDYAFAVGQAQADLVRPTIDQMESITNMWNTLIPRVNAHRSGMSSLGTKQKIRIY